MVSVLFYDSAGHHSSSTINFGISFLPNPNSLYASIAAPDNILKIVCICDPNASSIIGQVRQRQQDIIIYWCRKHCNPDTNSFYDPNIRDNIAFDTDNEWEIKVRMSLIKLCKSNSSITHALQETKKLREIKEQQYDVGQLPIVVKNEQENLSSTTPNEYPPSEEVQDKS